MYITALLKLITISESFKIPLNAKNTTTVWTSSPKYSKVSDLVGEELLNEKRALLSVFLLKKMNPESKHVWGADIVNVTGTIRCVFESLNAKKTVYFPPQNVASKASQKHIKENSNGGEFEEAQSLPTYHRSTSLFLGVNSAVFLSTKGAYNPHFWFPHKTTRPNTVGSFLRVGWKKSRFFSSPFSSLCFQAAMPLSRSLLSCRRLQHQLKREAGAAHFKVTNRLPGPDSCIKQLPRKKIKIKTNVRGLRMRRNQPWQSVFYVPWAFKLRFVDIFWDRGVASAVWGPYQRQAILSRLPEGLERQKLLICRLNSIIPSVATYIL